MANNDYGVNGVPRHSVNGVSKKFRRMSEIYRVFGSGFSGLDYDDAALLSLYNHESYGTELSKNNGFAVGKKYLNVQVAMWKEDLQRCWISKSELYEDGKYPSWWLDSVLENLYSGMTYQELQDHCRRL